MEQFPGPLEIVLRVSVEPPGEVGHPSVDRERVDQEPPGGEVKSGSQCTEWGQGQRVAEGGPFTQPRVQHGHHPIAGPRVVSPQSPAESVEVRELPGKEDAAQDKGARVQRPCAGRPPHDRRDGPHHGTDPRVVEAGSLEWGVEPSVEGYVAHSENSSQWVDCGPQESPSG